MATCIITNCRGKAPSNEPFCAKHRDRTRPEALRMTCARWDTGTGHGPKLQPLTLAFGARDTALRATRMGGEVHRAYEIVPVLVTIELAEGKN